MKRSTIEVWKGIGALVAGVALILAEPLLIVLGLWLLGVTFDWSSWKTYAGIIVLAIAVLS